MKYEYILDYILAILLGLALTMAALSYFDILFY